MESRSGSGSLDSNWDRPGSYGGQLERASSNQSSDATNWQSNLGEETLNSLNDNRCFPNHHASPEEGVTDWSRLPPMEPISPEDFRQFLNPGAADTIHSPAQTVQPPESPPGFGNPQENIGKGGLGGGSEGIGADPFSTADTTRDTGMSEPNSLGTLSGGSPTLDHVQDVKIGFQGGFGTSLEPYDGSTSIPNEPVLTGTLGGGHENQVIGNIPGHIGPIYYPSPDQPLSVLPSVGQYSGSIFDEIVTITDIGQTLEKLPRDMTSFLTWGQEAFERLQKYDGVLGKLGPIPSLLALGGAMHDLADAWRDGDLDRVKDIFRDDIVPNAASLAFRNSPLGIGTDLYSIYRDLKEATESPHEKRDRKE
jgi:hypothetical protein